jgi:hypothetical protein
MIKEALSYIISGFTAKIENVEGQLFSTQDLQKIPQATPAALQIRNLSGLVDYITNDYDKQPSVLIQVASPTEVNVFSTFNRDMQRNHLLQAKALLPSIPFEKFIDLESFNILLQSCFVPNEHRAALLALIGNVQEENVASFGDDGVSQMVTAKTGIATLAPVVVPNPVLLKPHRTFVDIEQPESQFIFRMQKGPTAALFEADGGAWRLNAIHTIAKQLSEDLKDQIELGLVTIIA